MVPDVEMRVGTEVPPEREVETEVPLQEEEVGTGVPPGKEVETEVPLQEEDGGAGVLLEKELEENPQVPLEEEESDGAEDAVGWGGFVSDAFSDGVTEDDELVVPLPLDVDRTGLERERKLWFLLVGWCLPPPSGLSPLTPETTGAEREGSEEEERPAKRPRVAREEE